MMSTFGERRLKIALAKFEPLTRFLDHFSGAILRKYRGQPALKQQGIQETARNTHELRYLLSCDGNDQLSLGFILTGEDGDVVLLRHIAGDGPGQVDQHVYRLSEVDDLKVAVQDEIIAQIERVS